MSSGDEPIWAQRERLAREFGMSTPDSTSGQIETPEQKRYRVAKRTFGDRCAQFWSSSDRWPAVKAAEQELDAAVAALNGTPPPEANDANVQLLPATDPAETQALPALQSGAEGSLVVGTQPQQPRELLCMVCGREHEIWSAANELWNRVLRRPDGSDEYPFICAACFMMLAVKRGVTSTFKVTDYNRNASECANCGTRCSNCGAAQPQQQPDACALALPVEALNHSLGWLDNVEGEERADDAIVKLADARGTPFAHVTAGWLRQLITATNGTRFGECEACGRNYAEHTPPEQAECDARAVAHPAQQEPGAALRGMPEPCYAGFHFKYDGPNGPRVCGYCGESWKAATRVEAPA